MIHTYNLYPSLICNKVIPLFYWTAAYKLLHVFFLRARTWVPVITRSPLPLGQSMGAIHGQGTTVTVRDNSIEQNRYKAAKLLLLLAMQPSLQYKKFLNGTVCCVLICNLWLLVASRTEYIASLSDECASNSSLSATIYSWFNLYTSALMHRWCSRRWRRKPLCQCRLRCLLGLHPGTPSPLGVWRTTKNCPAAVHPGLSRTDGARWCGLSRIKRRTSAPWWAPVCFIEDAIKNEKMSKTQKFPSNSCMKSALSTATLMEDDVHRRYILEMRLENIQGYTRTP